MAKIGELYLTMGIWKGRRIVPSAWVAESVVPRSAGRQDGYRYGRLWWMMPEGSLRDTTAFDADGYGGQYIFVFPRWRTVAVMTGWNLDRRPVTPLDFAKRVENAIAPRPLERSTSPAGSSQRGR